MEKHRERFYRILGENIRWKRRHVRLTQNDLAVCVGYKRAISISDIEAGHVEFSIGTLFDIAETLGCTIDELLPTFHELFPPSNENESCL